MMLSSNSENGARFLAVQKIYYFNFGLVMVHVGSESCIDQNVYILNINMKFNVSLARKIRNRLHVKFISHDH